VWKKNTTNNHKVFFSKLLSKLFILANF